MDVGWGFAGKGSRTECFLSNLYRGTGIILVIFIFVRSRDPCLTSPLRRALVFVRLREHVIYHAPFSSCSPNLTNTAKKRKQDEFHLRFDARIGREDKQYLPCKNASIFEYRPFSKTNSLFASSADLVVISFDGTPQKT